MKIFYEQILTAQSESKWMLKSFFETSCFLLRFDEKKCVAENVQTDSPTIAFLSRQFLVNLPQCKNKNPYYCFF